MVGKNTHKLKRSKHNSICCLVADRISCWYDNVETNVEYCLGECDVLASNPNRVVYYEIKSNFTEKSYKKSLIQLKRWTKYQHSRDNFTDYIGILYTPQVTKRLYKNGRRI